MVVLEGNTRPEANSRNDRGPVAGDFRLEHMQLQLRLPAEKQQELDQLTRDQQDPKSPNYHKWLTPAEFKQRFSLAPEDTETITAWLQSAGFTVDVINPQSIVFSGTAGQVRNAFRTEIHNLDVNDEKHIANMTNPQIPAALAPAVVGVISLNDFKPRPANLPRAAYTPGNDTFPVVPADLATIYNFGPAYGKGYTGTGQTIVVIEDSDIFTASDWFSFRAVLGLQANYPFGSFQQQHPAPLTGAYDCFDPGVVPGVEVEVAVDAEWASAAAPNATIEVASCADTSTNFGGFVALENLLNATATPPAIMSLSYSDSEPLAGPTFNAYINALYEQGASEGVSIFVSAGDSGAAGSDQNEPYARSGITVSGFASTPYNVAVGGTDFGDTVAGTTSAYWSATNSSAYGSAISYIPEIPWNDSCASGLIATYLGYTTTYGANGLCNSVASNSPLLTTGAGSGGPSGCATGKPSVPGTVGGTCAGYAKPYWQSVFGNPNDGVRDIPDVSLFAATGYWEHYFVICWSDLMWGGVPCQGAPSTWPGLGGTSFAAPIMAGIQALVNQKTGERQGNPNPVYYALAANEYGSGGSSSCRSTLGNGVGGSCLFYDVTQGDMDVNCTGSVNCYAPSGTSGVLSTSGSSYQPAFGATPGWDFATGIGTVNAYNLVESWPQQGITAVSGAPQTAVISSGFAASLVAKITDGSGNPVIGATVTFRAPASGASVTFAGGTNTAVTDLTGTATSAALTANATTGTYTVIATAPDIVGTANFSLTNTLSAPASVSVLSGTQQTATINMPFPSPLVAVVKDANGDPMSGITVTFAPSCSGSACATFVSGSSATTDAHGQATVSVDANGSAGVYAVTASVAAVTTPASFSLSNTMTTPVSASAATGSGQSAAITTTFAAPFTVTVVDSNHQPVSGAFVNFYANQSLGPSGTFTGGATSDREITDSNGKATAAAFTANLMAGSYAVFADAGSSDVADYILNNTPGPPASIMATSGSLQITTINSDFPQPLVVTVTDAGGNTVSAGAQVTFSVLSLGGAGATFAGANLSTATTNSQGVVSVSNILANGTGGNYDVLATVIVGGIGRNGLLNTASAIFNLTNLALSLSTAAPGTVQITAGTPASVTLNVGTTPVGVSLGQSVSLSCGVPAGLPETTCSLNPATLQVGHSGASATLTIDTTAKSRLASPRYEPRTGPLFPAWPWAALLVAMSMMLFAASQRAPQARRLPALFLLVVVSIAATALVSCSSSGSAASATSQTSSGTPAGASSISVTAQGDGMTATVQISINVN